MPVSSHSRIKMPNNVCLISKPVYCLIEEEEEEDEEDADQEDGKEGRKAGRKGRNTIVSFTVSHV